MVSSAPSPGVNDLSPSPIFFNCIVVTLNFKNKSPSQSDIPQRTLLISVVSEKLKHVC